MVYIFVINYIPKKLLAYYYKTQIAYVLYLFVSKHKR